MTKQFQYYRQITFNQINSMNHLKTLVSAAVVSMSLPVMVNAETTPIVVPDGENVYIVGDGISWVPGLKAMNSSEKGVYTWEGFIPKHTEGDTGRFRAQIGSDWSKPIHPLTDGVTVGETPVTETPLTDAPTTDGDMNWHAAAGGNYSLVFDLNNCTLKATYSQINVQGLYLIGAATPGNWEVADATPMTPDANNNKIYTWEGDLKVGEFKILTDLAEGYDGLTLHPLAANTPIGKDKIDNAPFACYKGGDDNKWNVSVAGTYRLTFNCEDCTMSSEFVKETEYEWPAVTPIETETLYLIGVVCGWNIDNAPACTKAAEGNVFVYDGQMPAGTFRAMTTKAWGKHIRPKVNNCPIGTEGYSGDFTYVDEPDFNWEITDAGTYRLTFDLDKWTIKAERQDVSSSAQFVIGNMENVPCEYYNLNGVRVQSPAKGVYIVKQGSKVSKVIIN